MAETKEITTQKKVFDVAKPSSTPADPTSRPLIVNHGPIAKDTTVVEDGPENEESTDKATESLLSKHAVIQPLVEQEVEPGLADEKVNNADERPKEEPTNEPSDEKLGPDPKMLSNAQTKKLEEEEQKRQHERKVQIDQLVSSGRYSLPINSVEKRKNRRLVIAGIVLCLLLMVVWYDVALDAGIVSNVLKLPHTRFFELKS